VSVELEATIMRELGLSHDYRWHEGSRSCRGVRRAAAAKLPQALRAHGLRAAPAVMNAVMAVAEFGDVGDETIRKTWQACATAIQGAIQRTDPRETADYIRHRFCRQLSGGQGWIDKDFRYMRYREDGSVQTVGLTARQQAIRASRAKIRAVKGGKR